MTKAIHTEFWLRGPVPGIPPLLQPAAHALLQACQEVNDLMSAFPDTLLWQRIAGLASPGFHLQHLAGVLDRLFTYARNLPLNESQLAYLSAEGTPAEGRATVAELLNLFNIQIDKALGQIGETSEESLTVIRHVGRAHLPSTVGGLLFHAAEHTQRHTGQLLVTARVLLAQNPDTGSPSSPIAGNPPHPTPGLPSHPIPGNPPHPIPGNPF